jgi:hypothetical protein
MITGIVRQTTDGWSVEHRYAAQDTPETITIAWRVTATSRTGAVAFAPTLADGLEVASGEGDHWSAYANGGNLVLLTEHEGTMRRHPLPCPRVRAGIETRYRDGRWEKWTKRGGWVAARCAREALDPRAVPRPGPAADDHHRQPGCRHLRT